MTTNDSVQDPRSDPGPQANGLYFLSNVLADVYDDNIFLPPFHPDDVSYEDNVPDLEVVYEREV